MSENALIGGALGIILFLAGIFFKDKIQKRRQVRDTVDQAAQDEQEGAAHAAADHEARVEQAREDAAAEIASRPHTGSAADLLADRIRRHAARKRASRQRAGSD